MSDAVAEKTFVWRFIDKVTAGVREAKSAMVQAENEVKSAGGGITEASDKWKSYGTHAKEATEKITNAVKKNQEDFSNFRRKAIEDMQGVTNHLDLYENKLKGIPKQQFTHFKVEIEDAKLKKLNRQIHDVPPEKDSVVKVTVKDNFSSPLQKAQQQANKVKESFSILKGTMAGTFVGGAVLNGVYAIGNGLRNAAAAGMEFDTEQQKMQATWKTLTGSAKAGDAMVDTINNLSVKTGQATQVVDELEQGFYHLHSSKSEADDMTKAMLNMGDAVGLTGEQMTQVSQDMVHGLATGKVTQGELNQIGMYFPMIDERMAEHYHTTVRGMRQMAKQGKISGKALEEVFEKMGNGNGKHDYKKAVENMMETGWGSMRTIQSMAPRLVGQLENGLFKARNPLLGAVAKWVQDPATAKSFNNFGKSITKGINNSISFVANLVKPFEALNKVIGLVLKSLGSGIFKGFAITIGLISTTVGTLWKAFEKLVEPINKASRGMKGYSSATNLIKGLGVVIGGATAILTTYKSAQLAVLAVTKTWGVATKAMTAAQTALNFVLDANPIGLIVIAIAALVGGFILAYKNIKPFRDAVNKLGKALKDTFTGNAKWEKDLGKTFNNISKDFAKFSKSVGKEAHKIGKSIGDTFTGKAGWEKELSKNFKNIQKEYQKNAKNYQKEQERQQKEQKKAWDNYWKDVTKKSQDAWNSIKKHASNGMNNAKKTIADRFKTISKSWRNGWKVMQDYTRNAWSAIKRHSSNGINNVHNGISSGLNTINRIWQAGWNAFANFFKGIWDGIKQAAADGINAVISIINAGISGIDKVWSFFTGHGTGISKLGKVHFAQGGIVHRHLSVINDGDGPDWKELVQMPDGGLFMSQERNWTGYLPEGARVYSGPETKAIMGMAGIDHYATGGLVGVQHFADGGIVGDAIDWAKGSLENIGSWIGDKIDALMKFLEHPVEEVKKVVNKAVSGMYSGAGHFGDLAKGNWDKLTDKMGDWITKHLEPVLDKLLESNPGGAGVARWRPYILRAAKQLGVQLSAGQMKKMLTQINTESHGNPNAIGGTDGLADGHATGLLQFKPRTFAHWAVGGHTNIMSGYDQILAAINCLNHGGEGGWGSFGIPGRGWATGGEILSQQFGWVGDNPQHHEFVLNPYAVSAEPLLDKAFEATAQAQPANTGNAQGGTSKLDRMITLLEKLLDVVGDIDPNVYVDNDKLTDKISKEQAKRISLLKG
ncbi:tape measure protein [uncultured Limosilactobacillus sp.]|uniref:tape measure protein n=1 Tax=uncultured Limosilactobacillus sp. TaxID=2837629 RepID=UPI0025E2546F|nr:tape measure protein [uncultured Limosilactobacillus sp.]